MTNTEIETRRAALIARRRKLGRQMANELMSDGDMDLLRTERNEVDADLATLATAVAS